LELEGDREASLALMPEAPGDWQWSRRFVAADAQGRLVGAAGLWQGPEHFRCDFRRSGGEDPQSVFALLWNPMLRSARERRADLIVGLRAIEADAGEAASWLALGFERDAVKITYETSSQRGFDELDRLLTKLRKRGKIPPEARVAGLREAPPAELVKLLADGLGMSTATASQMVSGGGRNRVHPALSCVALCGGETVAAYLSSRISDTTVRIESVVVKPGWRRSWANVWVKHEGVRRALASGKTTILLETGDEHGDSRRHAERVGGVIIRRTFLPVYRIGREDERDG
jgi:hypothetical protein